MMRGCVDLFSGIGGFSLAAHANGVETLCFVEKDERCREFLARAWPGVDIHDDVRTFDAVRYAGAWLVTGGVPCQPASRAGKQRGSEDDRWLWPAAVRVISEIRPAWALLENPPGIGDVGLAGVLSDLAFAGYETGVVSIPACAVGAPHRRERYWIIGQRRDLGDTRGERAERNGGCGVVAGARRGAQGETSQRERRGYAAGDSVAADELSDAHVEGSQGRDADAGENELRAEHLAGGHWANAVYVPCADGKFRRAPSHAVSLVDGLHRSVLGALGNSIVPQVAAQIIAAMIEAEETED